MATLSTIYEGARDIILSIAFVAVVGAGVPVIEVHAHDDPAFGHGHDVHVHSHGRADAADPDGSRHPPAPEEEVPHAHILGGVAVAASSPINVYIPMPACGPRQIPPPDSPPPDKPVRPLYRPPIA